MDIVLTSDGFRTLVDIVIIDPIHVDLVSQVISYQKVAATITTQGKIVSYCN
jgi:hypothetical protein